MIAEGTELSWERRRWLVVRIERRGGGRRIYTVHRVTPDRGPIRAFVVGVTDAGDVCAATSYRRHRQTTARRFGEWLATQVKPVDPAPEAG